MWRISSIIVLSLLASGATAYATPFPDVGSSPFATSIDILEKANIVEGYPDGTYRPNATINRAELLQILMKSKFKNDSPKDLRCFKDLEVKTPQWYARSTCLGRERGIVQGYPDGTFRPERTVSLSEALKMSMLTFGIVPASVSNGAWYEPYLREARSRKILLPLLTKPTHELTRGEMAAIIAALIPGDEEQVTQTLCGNGKLESGEQCDDGNTLDSDGCSSICLIVPEPVRLGMLEVNERTTGAATAIARGQRVPLLKFDATARRQDILLTSLTFTPTIGSLAFGESYQMAMDRDGDGIYEMSIKANVRVEGFALHVSFPDGIRLPKDVAVPFVLTADLPATMGPLTLGLGFATDRTDYVEAQGAEDGIGLQGISTNDACTASDCFISVDTTATAPIGIVDRGSLFVTADPLSPQSHILLVGSTTADPLLRLRLRAEGEDIDVHFLRITGIPSSVESLLLYRVPIGTNADLSNLTPIAQATSGQCRVQTGDTACVEFATSTLTVKNQEEIGLVVGAKIKGKSSGGLSGQSFTLSLVDSISDATHAIEARGVRSTGELAQNDGDAKAEGEIFIGTGTPGSGGPIIGKIQDTAFAAIDRITRSGPEYQPYITTGLSPIGSFTFHALPHANGPTEATLESLTFTVTAQNVTVDPVSMRLRPTNDPESWKSCRAAGTTGTITVTCDGLNADFFGTIPQGQDRTYELLVNIVNPEASPGASAIGAQLTPLGTPSQNNAVHWADGTTSFTWVNTGNTQVNGTVYQSK